MTLAIQMFEAPFGPLRLVARGDELVALHLPYGEMASSTPLDAIAKRTPILTAAQTQLREFFAGERVVFELPLAPQGTAFQRLVWQQLLAIPFGTTATYGDVARAIGRPAASRAVGAANGRNPIAIIIPCHRVIGADGTLTGYGGGMPTKKWLLAHERRIAPAPQASLPGLHADA